MSHWFDSACKSLAPTSDQGGFTRRNALLGMLGGMFAVASDAAWGQTSGSRPEKPVNQASSHTAKTGTEIVMRPGPCVQSRSADSYTRQVTYQHGDLTYEKALSYSATDQSIVDSVVIRQKNEIVLNARTHTHKSGASSAKLSYGKAYGHAGSASLTSTDGKRYTGFVNGKAVAGRVGSNASGHNLMFSDGKIVSGGVLEPQLRGPLTALLQGAHASAATCHTTQPVTGRSRIPQTGGTKPVPTTQETKFSPMDTSSPGDNWYNPGETYESPDCDNCWTNCESTAEQAAGTGDWKSWIDPIDIVTTIAVYDATLLGCWATCQLPGGGCCPVPCGGPFTCCGRGDNCFRGDICCPGSQKVCNNQCCSPDVTECSADGNCGCLSGTFECEDTCCQNGTECCGGQCCPAGGCHNNNFCCPDPKYVCGTSCCAPFTTCCNNQCCAGKCVNGACCPSTQVCGNTCCPPGSACDNGHCTGCPAGQKASQWFKYDGSLGGVICCPQSSPISCSGVCCTANQYWCSYLTGTPVCSAYSPIK
jgi:hypothetical protein